MGSRGIRGRAVEEIVAELVVLGVVVVGTPTGMLGQDCFAEISVCVCVCETNCRGKG